MAANILQTTQDCCLTLFDQRSHHVISTCCRFLLPVFTSQILIYTVYLQIKNDWQLKKLQIRGHRIRLRALNGPRRRSEVLEQKIVPGSSLYCKRDSVFPLQNLDIYIYICFIMFCVCSCAGACDMVPLQSFISPRTMDMMDPSWAGHVVCPSFSQQPFQQHAWNLVTLERCRGIASKSQCWGLPPDCCHHRLGQGKSIEYVGWKFSSSRAFSCKGMPWSWLLIS